VGGRWSAAAGAALRCVGGGPNCSPRCGLLEEYMRVKYRGVGQPSGMKAHRTLLVKYSVHRSMC
jgi:hypothetical protein